MLHDFNKKYIFLSHVILTILVTRLFLWLTWDSQSMVNQRQDSWHHMYTGIVLIVLSFILPKKVKSIVLAIGWGLFIDELVHVFHMLGLIHAVDYWSWQAIVCTIIGVVILRLCRVCNFHG